MHDMAVIALWLHLLQSCSQGSTVWACCSLSSVSVFWEFIYACAAALQRWLVCRTDGFLLQHVRLRRMQSYQSECVVCAVRHTNGRCKQPHVELQVLQRVQPATLCLMVVHATVCSAVVVS
jgi:hypothetical protein